MFFSLFLMVFIVCFVAWFLGGFVFHVAGGFTYSWSSGSFPWPCILRGAVRSAATCSSSGVEGSAAPYWLDEHGQRARRIVPPPQREYWADPATGQKCRVRGQAISRGNECEVRSAKGFRLHPCRLSQSLVSRVSRAAR
jgi:hypothetical protein